MSSSKIFIDTSFLLSFVDRTDFNHLKVTTIMEKIARLSMSAYTSSLVVQLAVSRMDKDLGAVVAQDFFQAMIDSNIQILFPDHNDFSNALKLIKSGHGRKVDLTEIINCLLMEKASIKEVLSTNPWHNLLGTQVANLMYT